MASTARKACSRPTSPTSCTRRPPPASRCNAARPQQGTQLMNFRPMKLLPLAMALAVVPMFAHGEDLLDAYHQAVANDPVLAQQLAQRNIKIGRASCRRSTKVKDAPLI